MFLFLFFKPFFYWSIFSLVQWKSELEQFIFQLIGRTPLVYLNKVTEGCGAYIAVKQEMMQPTASIKDRLPCHLSISISFSWFHFKFDQSSKSHELSCCSCDKFADNWYCFISLLFVSDN